MLPLKDMLSIPEELNINWKSVTSALIVLQYIFESYLDHRQYKVLKSSIASNHQIQKQKSQDYEYNIVKLRFDFVKKSVYLFRGLIIIKFDLLYKVWILSEYIMTCLVSFLPEKAMGNIIPQSVIFMNIILIVTFIFGLPFKYYEQFALQEGYGFNEQTIGQFMGKKIMRFPILLVCGSIAIVVYLGVLEHQIVESLLGVMCFNAVVSLLGETVFPILFMSFVKSFKTLEDGELKMAIENLASQEQFPLSRLHVYTVDGSRKGPEFLSQYSTAYFIGFPWRKQFVLYDTLISTYTTREILAVFAYEMEYSKHGHSIATFLLLRTYFLLLIWVYAALIHNRSLYSSFGFVTEQPSAVGLLLLVDIILPIECFLGFIRKLITRMRITKADKYASDCGYSKDLGTLLLKSSKKENDLTKSDIDWLYSTLYNSEPTLNERLTLLDSYQLEEKPEKVE